MKKEIANLLQKGVIIECSDSSDGFYSNMFLCSKKDESYLVILDLSRLNVEFQYQHFKME